MNGKKIMRSKDHLIAGVCAGIADYLEVDAVWVRIVYALLTVFTAFSGVIVYLILWFAMPRE